MSSTSRPINFPSFPIHFENGLPRPLPFQPTPVSTIKESIHERRVQSVDQKPVQYHVIPPEVPSLPAPSKLLIDFIAYYFVQPPFQLLGILSNLRYAPFGKLL